MIPQRVLDDILDKCDIVEIVSGCIPLKRSGRNFKANCPFHHEKTASFMVSPDKQIYHCFGCGAGGNAFNFLMKYERIEFMDAVKALAKKAGVELPQMDTLPPKEASLIDHLYKINGIAADFYAYNLLNGNAGKAALDYLQKRNITRESIVKFKLGYSLNGWDSLLQHMKRKGIEADLLVKAGLALPSAKDKSVYDRFRGRLIFPIFDVKNKIVAFGARVLDASLPKYINSPETPIYTKGRHLYGLNLSKTSIARENFAVIVEGYMDLISPYQAGVENMIASCGTALTIDQVRLLKRFSHDIVMVYDADEAGETASLRNLDILITEGLDVRVVSLPKGYDPDNFVTKHGAQAFGKLISEAKDLFGYKMGLLSEKYNRTTPEGKAKIAGEMLPTLWRVPNDVLKSGYLKQLAQVLDVDEAALRNELKKVKGDYTYSYETEAAKPVQDKIIKSAEKILISLMLEDRNLIELVKSELDCDVFQEECIRKIVKAIYDSSELGKDITSNKLVSHLDDERAIELVCELASDAHNYTDKEKNLRDCIKWIKENSLKDRLKILHEEICAAQVSNDHARLKELVAQYNQLIKNRKN